MVTIYYLIIVMLLMAELLYLVNAKKVSKLVVVCRYFFKKNRKKNLLHNNKYRIMPFMLIFHSLYSIFLLFIILVGLFSFQWSFFLLFLVYQICVGIMVPVKDFNVVEYTKFLKFNTSIQIVFLLFFILNHYQFHFILF